ncbi:MAG: oxidoreductase protein [Segetibacter sp.]|nr:oxidoreductase protein [Segetibacter sp.]
MPKLLPRRIFIRDSSTAALGVALMTPLIKSYGKNFVQNPKRIGIIGLDTSHSVAFAKALNGPNPSVAYTGFTVTAAYPQGSADIVSSTKRIAGYTEDIKKLGIEIAGSIEELLTKSDFILLETNDGRPHLEQALQVIKAGKTLFIDKPVAGSLHDAIAIYAAAEKYKVPVFSSSSLRYMETVQEVVQGKVGKVLGADTYSPATLEKTHPDLFWYGIHGVEILFTVMGKGCKEVVRVTSANTDIVVGTWEDGRTGTFRGTRTGTHDYGGTAYGEKGNYVLGPFKGYDNLLDQIIAFFKSGIPPVSAKETLEIYTFMEAADESKRNGGKAVLLKDVYDKHSGLAKMG